MLAYLDLPSGLSGDMMLGCLVSASWPIERLRATIEAMPLPAAEWAVTCEPVMKGALAATKVDVLADEGRVQRRLADVTEIIAGSSLPPAVREKATAVFTRLADAEAAVHGTTPDQVHFHEVGAVDAIIDIVASINGLHELGVTQLFASAVPLGPGWASTAHGKLPLPAPATLQLLTAAHAPIRPAPGPGELVTPTGAALLATLATFSQPPMTLSRLGTGAGTKDFAWPNIARLWLGEPIPEPPPPPPSDPLVQLETNIDDMNPQLYASVINHLFAAGAKDVWLTPVQMKKQRPGVVLSVLASSADEKVIADLLLRETTTLGVRVLAVPRRHEAQREMRQVQTSFGMVRIKVKSLQQRPVAAMPEYDDCRALADQHHVPVHRVFEAALIAGAALVPAQLLVPSPGTPGEGLALSDSA